MNSSLYVKIFLLICLQKVDILKEAFKNENFGLSIGSAWSQDKNDLRDLIKKADNVMYSYKNLEKNNAVL